mgnify:CR=1
PEGHETNFPVDSADLVHTEKYIHR